MITLKEYWSNENYKVLLALILSINAIVFIPIIILLPQFILDDFYIFHVIENVNPYPIAININEEFYLFLRPVAYFIMWIGNTLFGTHSIFYKLFHFVFHLVFVAVVYDFLFKIMQWKGFSIKSWKALLILVFLTINPIVLYWIVEINNITELLMILFYAASLRSIFIYIFINHSNKYLLLYALFFILSALSKQIGLHLPLLILVFLYALRSKIGRSVFNKSYNISIILLIFTLAYSLINALVYSEQVGEIFAVLWKKPFAAVGIIILTLNSLIGNYIYYFFLDKKLIALITALIIIIIAGLYFRKKNIPLKRVLYILLVSIIIFYPRSLQVGQGRINSIILLWIGIGFFYLLANRKKYFPVIVSIILLANVFSVYYMTNVFYDHFCNRAIQIEAFSQIDLSDGDRLVITADDHMFNFIAHFYLYNKFGNMNFNTFPVTYISFSDDFFLNRLEEKIKISKSKRTLTLVTMNDDIEITPRQNKLSEIGSALIGRKKNARDRGYSKLVFNLDEELSNKKIIYFNGQEWLQIN